LKSQPEKQYEMPKNWHFVDMDGGFNRSIYLIYRQWHIFMFRYENSMLFGEFSSWSARLHAKKMGKAV